MMRRQRQRQDAVCHFVSGRRWGEPGRPGKRIHLFYGAPACRGGYAVGKRDRENTDGRSGRGCDQFTQVVSRGLANVTVCICEGVELELPLYCECPAEYQVQKEERRILKYVEGRGDRLRFKQEVTLPKEKPDIHMLLWQDVRLEQMSIRQNNEGVEIAGMLYLFALYETGQELRVMPWYEDQPAGLCADGV